MQTKSQTLLSVVYRESLTQAEDKTHQSDPHDYQQHFMEGVCAR